MQIGDGLSFLSFAGHFDKGEAPLATGFTVEGKAAFVDFAVLAEELLDVLLLGVKGEVAHVNCHEPGKETMNPIRRKP